MGTSPLSGTGSAEDGFTLIEVLVALAILSMSLAALFVGFSSSLDRTRKTSDAATALVYAQSLLDMIGAELALEPSGYSGELQDDTFRWRAEITTFGLQDDTRAWPVDAFKATVTVQWGDQPEESITLKSLKVRGQAAR